MTDLRSQLRRVRSEFWPKAKNLLRSLPFAEDLLAAYYCAMDEETPSSVRLTLLGALAYFITPIDLIPDFVPFVGFTDDASVIAAAIAAVSLNIRDRHREAARRAMADAETAAERA
ncbi:YkvA family protein [Methylopila musalis]|uniref:YkvA family protein n=1 Tax=Methylopila musalis TaxID=1134781 RepID=A0ABW3Z7P5_9HYPH